MAAISWPTTLLTFSAVIDNPWGTNVRRSAECGRHLAEVLLKCEHGKRPVSLIGFSLGARVIFFCLLELAQRENSEGIIQDAILLGSPVSGSLEYWRRFSKVVAGRIVNGYCRGDWLLKFLYRTTNAAVKIAGLYPIDLKDRRMENVDLSDVVTGHLDYYKKMPEVLKKIGLQVNENELNKENGLMMKRSATGLPKQNYLVEEKASDVLNYCSNIRMSISEPNLVAFKNEKDTSKSIESNGNLIRSLSFEDLQIKKNKKFKMRLSQTCKDFKRESLQLKDLPEDSNSIGSCLNESSASNNPSDLPSNNLVKTVNNKISDEVIPASNGNSSRLSRFNFFTRFTRRPANIEELKKENENKILEDELSNVDEDNKLSSVLGNLLQDNIIKDEKLKDELNNKIKDELKVEIDVKVKDQNLKNELKDNMKLNELNEKSAKEANNRDQIEFDSPIKTIKRDDSDFLLLNVENLKNNGLKRI